MKIRCVWEHNGNDSIVYSDNFAGAYTRGRTREEAIRKMPLEIAAYLRWAGKPLPDVPETELFRKKHRNSRFPTLTPMCFLTGNGKN